MELSKGHKGAAAEMLACAWLLNQGYEVFRNISQCGLADLIAKNGNEIIFIDVTKATYRENLQGEMILHRHLAKEKKANENGIRVLYTSEVECIFMDYAQKKKIICKKCESEFEVFGSRKVFCTTRCKKEFYSYENYRNNTL